MVWRIEDSAVSTAERVRTCRGGQGLAARLHDRLAGEDGIALFVAIMLMMIVSSLALVIATEARTSDSQSRRDRSAKRALSAADAGIDAAIYRVNKMQPVPNQCSLPIDGGQLGYESAGPDGWCTQVIETIDDSGASYTYQMTSAQAVSPNGQDLLQRKVVSTGTVDGVKRRVLTVFGANTGKPLIGNYAIISGETLDIGNTVKVSGDVGSNGNIYLSNTATICGKAVYGPGKEFRKKNQASQGPPQCSQDYSAQNAEANPAFVLNPPSAPSAPYDGNDSLTATGYSGWNSATRELRVSSGFLTLTGSVYDVCFLEISHQAQLIIPVRAPGSPVKIYIDRPENCPNLSKSSPILQLDLGNQAKITNLNSDPRSLIIFGLGSAQYKTEFSLDNGFADEVPMVIYAPQTTVSLKNTVKIVGGIAAKKVSVGQSVEIRFDPLAGTLTFDALVPLYTRQSWGECKPLKTGTAPDSGC